MMSPTVTTLWILLLVVAALAVPVIVALLHGTWQASRSIARYILEMREAGEGISSHTGNISALEETRNIAGNLLSTAEDLDEHARSIDEALQQRATRIH